jgi:hypothetical protein
MFLVATEDALCEAVARKLLIGARVREREITFVGKKGSGYLRKNLRKYLQASSRFPVLLLTDLDSARCAPSLVAEWMDGETAGSCFLFRVAVREVEAWLLADRRGFAEFLGVSEARIERDTETIADPKRYLLELARLARRELRRGLLPAPNAAARQGFEYNSLLCGFVTDKWSEKRAASGNRSLRAAIERLNSRCGVIAGRAT